MLSGTTHSRNLHNRRFTVDQGYSDQKTNRKIPQAAATSTVSAISFTSREGKRSRQRNIDSATFKPNSESSQAQEVVEANFTSIAYDSIQNMDTKARIKAERRTRLPPEIHHKNDSDLKNQT